MNSEFTQNDYLIDLDLYAHEVEVKWNLKGMKRDIIKRTRNRRAIAVYSSEMEGITDTDEKVSIVRETIASGKKGRILLTHLESFVPIPYHPVCN
jgi:hypothetical protein